MIVLEHADKLLPVVEIVIDAIITKRLVVSDEVQVRLYRQTLFDLKQKKVV